VRVDWLAGRLSRCGIPQCADLLLYFHRVVPSSHRLAGHSMYWLRVACSVHWPQFTQVTQATWRQVTAPHSAKFCWLPARRPRSWPRTALLVVGGHDADRAQLYLLLAACPSTMALAGRRLTRAEFWVSVLLMYNRVNAWLPLKAAAPSRQEVMDVFYFYDKDHNDTLSFEEFRCGSV
jgi:hypothetical protein